MRRIFWILLLLILFIVLGYYISINNHNVPLRLFGQYSVHLSLWIIVASAFLTGVVLSELRNLLFNPSSLIQRMKRSNAAKREKRKQQRLQEFYDGCVRKRLPDVEKAYSQLKFFEAPSLALKTQFLKQQKYQISTERLLEGFSQLNQKNPNQLQVLIPYLKVAVEVKQWGLSEKLAQDVLGLSPHHPEALEALRNVYLDQKNWKLCVEKEINLLSRYPNSLIAEKIIPEHEAHFLEALKQHPSIIETLNWKYIPNSKLFKEKHLVALVLAEAKLYCRTSQFDKAAKSLFKNYGKTGAIALLDALEQVFYDSGEQAKILDYFRKLQNSPAKSIFVDLVMCRILYQQGKYKEIEQELNNIEKQYSVLPRLYHALHYLVSIPLKNTDSLLKWGEKIVSTDSLLKHNYLCRNCSIIGEWNPICPQCGSTYSYTIEKSEPNTKLLT